MSKSCFDGYLTGECASCSWWRDEPDCCGCAAPFPIMHCDSFAKMYNEQENTQDDKYFETLSNLPKAIYTITKNGEIIVMEANTFTWYTKAYYRTSDINATDFTTLRRVKHVCLPVHIDGVVYTTTDKLFNHLRNTGRYSLCGW